LGRRSWLRTSPSLRPPPPPSPHTFYHMRKELELVFKTLCSVQKARQWPKSENQETLKCITPPSKNICLFATLQLKQFEINQSDKIISVRFSFQNINHKFLFTAVISAAPLHVVLFYCSLLFLFDSIFLLIVILLLSIWNL